jgi:hypothetical protein
MLLEVRLRRHVSDVDCGAVVYEYWMRWPLEAFSGGIMKEVAALHAPNSGKRAGGGEAAARGYGCEMREAYVRGLQPGSVNFWRPPVRWPLEPPGPFLF